MFGSPTVAQPYSSLPQDVLLSLQELCGKGNAGGMDEGHLSLCPQQGGAALREGLEERVCPLKEKA